MQPQLGRCAEHLRKAVVHLACSSGTPQEKLSAIYNSGGFGTMLPEDFPTGSLRNGYLIIRNAVIKSSEPQIIKNIAAMSDDEAYRVIEEICDLSDSVAYALGAQSSP
jgi:hypothetical protein